MSEQQEEILDKRLEELLNDVLTITPEYEGSIVEICDRIYRNEKVLICFPTDKGLYFRPYHFSEYETEELTKIMQSYEHCVVEVNQE